MIIEADQFQTKKGGKVNSVQRIGRFSSLIDTGMTICDVAHETSFDR